MSLPFSRATIPAVLAGAVGVLVVLYAWRLPPFTSSVQSTDDAYVRGPVTLIAPQIAGLVVEIPVHDYASVRRGDLLVRIDDRGPRARLAQAQAQVAAASATLSNLDLQQQSREANVAVAEAGVQSAEAALGKAQLDVRRIQPLLEANVQSRARGDDLQAALREAEAAAAQARASRLVAQRTLAETVASRANLEAALQGAQAALAAAAVELANTRVLAPADGRLGEVSARIGQYAAAGTQLTALVPDLEWVIANFKETQVGAMRPGQPARFRVDALGGQEMLGRIERFSPAAGSEFSVIRPDNATGNFTKVAQRIPVRIAIDPGQALADRLVPGMSVVVSVDTAAAPLPLPAEPAAAAAPAPLPGNAIAPPAPATRQD